MNTALVICFNDLKNDARVTRQVNFLKDSYNVTACCFDANPDPKVTLYKVRKTKLTFTRKAVASVFLLARMHMVAYWILHDYREHISRLKNKFDLIVANDIEALPFAFEVGGGHSKIFFDAHEYAPRQFEDRLYWRIFFRNFNNYLCRKYIDKTDGMSVINDGMALAYEREFGVKSIVITNASDYVEIAPVPKDQYPIRIVHHGIFTLSRQPDIMIEMMKKLDNRFTLDLIYLIPENSSQKTVQYYKDFTSKATATGRVKILPALKGNEIIPFIHEHYDMGIILVPPVNFNYENGLPNKLFDCIQARLAMAVGPLREIAKVINDNGIGIVSEDFTAESMANALKNVRPEDVTRFKRNADTAAKRMNASFNKKLFLDALSKLG
jgi:hypothetical protein